jgi:uncharacterized membrane protein
VAKTSLWHRHPGVRSGDQLTRGERAADWVRTVMGSWGFVFGALLFLAGWMVGNGRNGFDPYPFILLNLVLSCLAALQGAILLIAARRADQVSAELALHDYEADKHSQETVDTIYQMIVEMHRKTFPTPVTPADDASKLP